MPYCSVVLELLFAFIARISYRNLCFWLYYLQVNEISLVYLFLCVYNETHFKEVSRDVGECKTNKTLSVSLDVDFIVVLDSSVGIARFVLCFSDIQVVRTELALYVCICQNENFLDFFSFIISASDI